MSSNHTIHNFLSLRFPKDLTVKKTIIIHIIIKYFLCLFSLLIKSFTVFHFSPYDCYHFSNPFFFIKCSVKDNNADSNSKVISVEDKDKAFFLSKHLHLMIELKFKSRIRIDPNNVF